DYAAAHALLRRVLSHDRATSPHAWRFDRTPSGKPFLIEPGAPSFSLSHTQGLVACALAADAVGVDVEATDRDLDIPPIAPRFLRDEAPEAAGSCGPTGSRPRFSPPRAAKGGEVKGGGPELVFTAPGLSLPTGGGGQPPPHPNRGNRRHRSRAMAVRTVHTCR